MPSLVGSEMCIRDRNLWVERAMFPFETAVSSKAATRDDVA